MKNFLTIIAILIGIYFTYDIVVFYVGWYVDFNPDSEIEVIAVTEGKNILIDNNGEYEPFEIKGVNISAAIPGKFTTDYAISKNTYLRWFNQISEMGANTIKIHTFHNPEFYEAFKEYNENSDIPLYLIQGITVDDYIKNSHRDGYAENFRGTLIKDIRITVDVIHGRRKLFLNSTLGTSSYTNDVSEWVLGYLIGNGWEDTTIIYTDDLKQYHNSYYGQYIRTKDNVTAYETLLAEMADLLISYETNKYKSQRLVSFVSSPETDPFEYSEEFVRYYKKIASLDIEKFGATEAFLSGLYASYNLYSYSPDYYNYDVTDGTPRGNEASYREYLERINEHHTIPLIITEFGYSSSRGQAQPENYRNDSLGGISETEQAQNIIRAYNDIASTGCSGAILATWQDDWYRTTWNTLERIDTVRTPFWSDVQTAGQSYGILSFDPGKEKSIVYVDGDISEWNKSPLIINNNLELYSEYDEKYIYLMIKGYDGGKLYVPIDLTAKSGSKLMENTDLEFSRYADFMLVIDGTENTRLMVQERYEVLRAMNLVDIESRNPYLNQPDKYSPVFKNIDMILQSTRRINDVRIPASTYETGKLTHGISNPDYDEYNSLADFYISGDVIEIKIPWQLLNFSDPSQMRIHDDYYENYGVEYLIVNKIYFGIGKSGYIDMNAMSLKPWRNTVTYHERLKCAYYELQKIWKEANV